MSKERFTDIGGSIIRDPDGNIVVIIGEDNGEEEETKDKKVRSTLDGRASDDSVRS